MEIESHQVIASSPQICDLSSDKKKGTSKRRKKTKQVGAREPGLRWGWEGSRGIRGSGEGWKGRGRGERPRTRVGCGSWRWLRGAPRPAGGALGMAAAPSGGGGRYPRGCGGSKGKLGRQKHPGEKERKKKKKGKKNKGKNGGKNPKPFTILGCFPSV